MVCSAPRKSTATKGTNRHTNTSTAALSAVSGSVSQNRYSPTMPSCHNSPFSAPYSPLKIQRHACPDTTGGIAHGTMITVRSSARPRKSRLSTSAKTSPMASTATMATAMK